jgi:hypothetical protein
MKVVEKWVAGLDYQDRPHLVKVKLKETPKKYTLVRGLNDKAIEDIVNTIVRFKSQWDKNTPALKDTKGEAKEHLLEELQKDVDRHTVRLERAKNKLRDTIMSEFKVHEEGAN